MTEEQYKIIERKIAAFSIIEIINKAREEAKELCDELENLLLCRPEITFEVLKKVAQEYADVEIAVHDTLGAMFLLFLPAYEAKRKLVYEERLPALLDEAEGKK